MIIEFDTKYRKAARDYQKWHISEMHVFSDYNTIFQKRIRRYVYDCVQNFVMIKICILLNFNIGIRIEDSIKERLRNDNRI